MFRDAVVLTTIRTLPNGQSELYEKHLFSSGELRRWQLASMQHGFPIFNIKKVVVWEG